MPCTIVVAAFANGDPDDPIKAALRYERGDIIEILPYDHRFTEHEVAHPLFLILRLLNVSEEQIRDLVAPSFYGHARMQRRRAAKLDIDHAEHPQALKMYVANKRHSRDHVLGHDEATLRNFVVKKLPVDDPTIIGDRLSTGVIG